MKHFPVYFPYNIQICIYGKPYGHKSTGMKGV